MILIAIDIRFAIYAINLQIYLFTVQTQSPQ